MKHGKRPTVAQRKLLTAWHLDPATWLVVKDTPEVMELVHRNFDHIRRTIPKRREAET